MPEQSIGEMFQKSCLKFCSSWRFVSVAWKLLSHGGIVLPDGSRIKRSSPRRKTIPELYKHKCRVLWGDDCAEWSQRMGLCIHGSWGGDSWHHYKYKLACKEHTRVKSAFVFAQQAWDSASPGVPRAPLRMTSWCGTGENPQCPCSASLCPGWEHSGTSHPGLRKGSSHAIRAPNQGGNVAGYNCKSSAYSNSKCLLHSGTSPRCHRSLRTVMAQEEEVLQMGQPLNSCTPPHLDLSCEGRTRH